MQPELYEQMRDLEDRHWWFRGRRRIVSAIPGPFDRAGMLDLLEHIGRDRESLRTVHGLLAPRGCLLLTVPALAFLRGPHDQAHHHKRRYRAPALRSLLEGTRRK